MAIDPRTPRVCECGDHAFAETSRRGVALVSPQDAPLLEQRWQLHPRGYAQNRSGKLHRAILRAPEGKLVDHINHDRLDCRRPNLRLATDAQSVRNRRKLRRRGNPASRYIGVHRNGNGWIARISIDGVRKSVGTYASQKAAALAYDEAASRFVGEFAQLNFGR